jgi:hypothetical protein
VIDDSGDIAFIAEQTDMNIGDQRDARAKAQLQLGVVL